MGQSCEVAAAAGGVGANPLMPTTPVARSVMTARITQGRPTLAGKVRATPEGLATVMFLTSVTIARARPVPSAPSSCA